MNLDLFLYQTLTKVLFDFCHTVILEIIWIFFFVCEKINQ